MANFNFCNRMGCLRQRTQ